MVVFRQLYRDIDTLRGKSFVSCINKITKQRQIRPNDIYIHLCIFNLAKSMQDQKRLSQSLMMLACQILNKKDSIKYQKLQLGRQLFLDIDRSAFKQLFQLIPCEDFVAMNQNIQAYYRNHFHQNILWSSQLLLKYSDPLILTFVFVFDLALKTGKDTYIERILTMQQEQQIALQPFVAAIAQREEFVQSAPKIESTQKSQKEHVFQLVDQNDKLVAERDEWIRKYNDLRESYDYLKTSHDRQSDELNFLKQERYHLINQLGGSECGSIEETVDKVRRQLGEYQITVDKLHRELEQKKRILAQKNDQLRHFQQSFKANAFLQKAKRLQQMIEATHKMQKQLKQVQQRQDELRGQLAQERTHALQREQKIESLNSKLSKLTADGEKYNEIKKIHSEFKARMFRDIRQKT